MMTDDTPPTTHELLRRADVLSFAPDRPVSSRSAWSDPVWRLDVDESGFTAAGVGLYWTPGLPEGWDPRLHDGGKGRVDAALVDDFRKFVWIALADPRLRFVRKITGAPSLMTGVTSLMREMRRTGSSSLADITPAFTERYMSEMVEEFTAEQAASDEGTNDAPSMPARIKSRLATLGFIWKARRQLREAGVPVPERDPLSGRSASAMANYAAEIVEDAVPPIPDEVYLRIVNAAERLIAVHAADVVEAQRIWFETTGGLGGERERVRGYEALEAFRCSTNRRSPVRWPASLGEVGPNDGGASTSASLGLHNLLAAVRDACLLTVMATSGMRLSEVISIRGGWTPGNAHPDCIAVERSESGMLDLFFVRADLLKRQATPLQDVWLVGSRLAGTDEVPLAVRAIETLERLMSPWRGLSTDPEAQRGLTICMDCPGLPWKPTSVRRMTRHRFSTSVKQFYRRFVVVADLPDVGASLDAPDLRTYRENGCANVRVHQYRKNFAKFMLRVDGRLLPALKRQYKHLRVATLQTGYIGRNPALLAGSRDERRLSQNRGLADMLGLATSGGGGVAKVIARHRALLRARAELDLEDDGEPTSDTCSAGDAGQAKFGSAMSPRYGAPSISLDQALASAGSTAGRLSDLIAPRRGQRADRVNDPIPIDLAGAVPTLLPGEHGNCGIAVAPHLSRCNALSGSASFLNPAPDPLNRTTTVCVGCQLFLADRTHISYWRRRYLVNERLWRSARRQGLEADYAVAARRSEQSRAMLRALGYARYDR